MPKISICYRLEAMVIQTAAYMLEMLVNDRSPLIENWSLWLRMLLGVVRANPGLTQLLSLEDGLHSEQTQDLIDDIVKESVSSTNGAWEVEGLVKAAVVWRMAGLGVRFASHIPIGTRTVMVDT